MAATGQTAFAVASAPTRSIPARHVPRAALERHSVYSAPSQDTTASTPAARRSLRGVWALASTVAVAALSARPRRVVPRRPIRAGAYTVMQSMRMRQRHATCLTEQELTQLARGLTVQRQQQRGSSGTGLVVMDIDAPPFLVIERLSAFEDYASTIPVVRHSEVSTRVTRADGTVHARADYKISKFRLGVSVVHEVDIADGTVSFELDSSMGRAVLHEASGQWRVEQSPGNLGGSRVWLEVGLRASNLLPQFIIDYAAKRALRRATTWLKPHMESLWQKRKLRLLGMQRDVAGAGARCNAGENAAPAMRLAHA